ncbi:uncharacterized protein LOC141856299 [Brevipalpus obovatus]|uniref:uncharacterized protein LOC141856299 n=1 Tax=Brevipalpus obovatus TaxID=246614 RepID=UPI003D9F864F
MQSITLIVLVSLVGLSLSVVIPYPGMGFFPAQPRPQHHPVSGMMGHGYNPSGYNPSGYNPSGYNPSGYNPSGFTRIPHFPITCPHNQVWDMCHSSCTETCENKDNPPPCVRMCKAGCGCPSGKVLNQIGQCIHANEC